MRCRQSSMPWMSCGVEEDAEVLAAGPDELAVIGLDPVLELGDAALGVVAPGVADEEVVGHGRCLVGVPRRHGDSLGRPRTPADAL